MCVEFVVGVGGEQVVGLPFEEFAVGEEAFQFGLSRFGSVAGMNDVFLVAHGVVSAYGSGGRQASVGGAGQCAHGFDGAHSFEAHCHDGAGHHGVFDALEEGLLAEVGVVFGEDFVGELHHFEAHDVESFLFEDGDDFADECALHGAGLEQYECAFHSCL